MACDGNLDETFTRLSQNKELLILPHASLSLFVCMCLSLGVCSCFWSCSLADIYRRVQGGCRITFHRRGPREQWGVLSATWLSTGCSAKPPPSLVLPPGPSLRQLQRSPYCWQLSLLPFLPLFAASISRRYSIHCRQALITKQDYGPCLGTTCQGACSLSCLLFTTCTLQRRVLFVCFWKIWLPRMETQSKSLWNLLQFASPSWVIDAYLRILPLMSQWSINM